MDVTRALSMAQEELKDYDLEGNCLSLYDGSDFIILLLLFFSIKLLILLFYLS